MSIVSSELTSVTGMILVILAVPMGDFLSFFLCLAGGFPMRERHILVNILTRLAGYGLFLGFYVLITHLLWTGLPPYTPFPHERAPIFYKLHIWWGFSLCLSFVGVGIPWRSVISKKWLKISMIVWTVFYPAVMTVITIPVFLTQSDPRNHPMYYRPEWSWYQSLFIILYLGALIILLLTNRITDDPSGQHQQGV